VVTGRADARPPFSRRAAGPALDKLAPVPALDPTPTFEPEALVGTTLDGRYILGAHLATGGMGAVFRATHVYMRKEVAIKVLRPDLTASGEIVERFRREAEIAASLDHPNIVRVSDFGRSPEGYLFLVMELLHGESLFDRIRREGSLPPDEAVPILVQICHALEAAHARCVVHRDLKPENVFLARNAQGGETTKILDFGIAKIADAANVGTTQAGMVVGTPEYLAPEQALGVAVDARADLYAVGLIAWRTLVGRHPFKAEDARGLLMMQASRPVPAIVEARPELGEYPALATAIARACEKDVAARTPTAGALAAELADALGPAWVPVANPTSTPAPPRTPAPRPSSRFVPFLPGLEVPPAVPVEPTPTPILAPRSPAPAARVARAALALFRARVAEAAARTPRRARFAAGVVAALAVAIALAVVWGDRAPHDGAAEGPSQRSAAPKGAAPTRVTPAASLSGESAAVATLVAKLADRSCAVRRAAARTLAELGDPAALPKLRALAATTRSPDGFHGLSQPEPACGAAEAADAVRRIEAARRATKGRRPSRPAST
jgi:eukaryotic-like serine/threonine-protein kinase